ncbi:MAG: pyruvate ferredoxin oxidoreductase [Planctomycetes bacterium DG_23]|nr:MAG: pyruvate ferredoxin oxidoreductase [Planctomycetes bacterium DG_23]
MKEIRIHARAGQGAITTAQLLGMAAFAQERYAYAFPHFGAARMGAPMNSFVRIDDKEIRLRSQVYEPDYVLVVDATLMRGFDVLSGLKPGGAVIINEREDVPNPEARDGANIYSVPANKIAQEVLGRPLGNTVLLGAFAAATGEIELEALNKAISERFAGKVAEGNIEAAKRGFDYIKENYAKD